MLKGVDKLNNYLTNWFKANKIDIDCELATDFGFDINKNKLYYAVVLPETESKVFSEIICKPLTGKVYNPFILFLFHEVGHKYTIDKFNNLDLENKPASRDYYYQDVEYEATQWGCEYINNNLEKVKQLYEEFMSLVKDFYIVNEVVY